MPGLRKPARRAGRQVIFDSPRGRWERAGAGALITLAAVVIVLPVLATETGPPPPPSPTLLVATNSFHTGPAVLELDITSNGCENPVQVEGTFKRAPQAWSASPTEPNVDLPNAAAVVVVGAQIEHAQIGLGNSRDHSAQDEPGQSPYSSTHDYLVSERPSIAQELREGAERQPTPAGGINFKTGPEHHVTIRSTASAPVGERARETAVNPSPAWSAITLRAPKWLLVKGALRFKLALPLVLTTGYHKCYVEVPQIVPSNLAFENEREGEAVRHAEHLLPAVAGEGLQGVDEIQVGKVSVTVHGHVPALTTIAADGKPTATGIYYQCHRPAKEGAVETPEQETKAPTLTGAVNLDCADDPLFEVPGTNSAISRHTFFGGIAGALGLTLLMDGIFAVIGPAEERKIRA